MSPDAPPENGPAKDSPGKALLGKSFSLVYTHRGLKKRFRIGSGTITIGSSSACNVRIYGPGVAGVHCRIEEASDGSRILFAASDEHPVYVNGEHLEFRTLEGGERISLGGLKVEVHAHIGLNQTGDGVREEISYEGSFGEQLRQSFRRSHWMLLSCIVHFALIILISRAFEEERIAGGSFGIIQQNIEEWSGDMPSLDNPGGPEEEIEFDEPAAPIFDAPEATAFDEPMTGEEHLLKDPDQFGPYGQGGEGLDRAGSLTIGKAIGRGDDGVMGFGKGTGWNEHVGKLRSTGLDVAILFDSTGSMVNLIKEVKSTISEMAKVLDRVVPDLRIALITYKGDEYASRYVVAGTPLVADTFELLNFISSVEISGGSAEGYAAIDRGLAQALNNLAWRKGTQKAIVIIGDAAPFPETHIASLQKIRKFKGSVSAIYKNSEHTPGELEPVTINTFRKYAMAGRGEFIRYDVSGDVVRHITNAILGTEWEEQIRAVFAYREAGRWQKVLERRVDNRDIDWFMNLFVQQRTRPEAVDALVQIGGKEVAARIWKIIKDGTDSPWLMQRCIYVLNKLTNIHINYIESSRSRLSRNQLRYIKDVLVFTFGKKFDELPTRNKNK